ncbi:hypothetical protein ACQ4PT_055588 [Festuca glaucescens]
MTQRHRGLSSACAAGREFDKEGSKTRAWQTRIVAKKLQIVIVRAGLTVSLGGAAFVPLCGAGGDCFEVVVAPWPSPATAPSARYSERFLGERVAENPRSREDRLSKLKLSDVTLGRILSFLPAKEAARASALSSRWRSAYAGVDAVTLEEPESPIPDYEEYGCGSMSCSYGRPVDPNPKPPFATTVTAALLARHLVPAAPAPPLRALRVALDHYRREDASTVNHWVSYALKYAAPAPVGLELDLHLRRVPVCSRPYSLCAASSRKRSRSTDADEEEEANSQLQCMSVSDDDDMSRLPQYTVPQMLFSSLGPCKLSPPDTISLPSLEALLLARVSDGERSVQRLVYACPRLTDLTLEARLYLINDKLHTLEYRGAVPGTSLVALRRGGRSKLTSCKIDICGKEVSSEKELAKFGKFLQLVASTKHLHLRSARLGCGVDHDALAWSLPEFRRLLHLELTGRLPHGDGDAAVAAVSRILLHAPNLEVLSLFLDTDPSKEGLHARKSWHDCKEGEFVRAHQLRYNKYEVLTATPAVIIPCLRKRVREINFVHYHGGRAQRTLAKFLLCNAPVLKTL